MTSIKEHYLRDKYITNINVYGSDKLNGQSGIPRFKGFKAKYSFPESSNDIPRVIHFVWIGSPIPDKYIKNIGTFVAKYLDNYNDNWWGGQTRKYNFKLWVDHDTPSIENVKICNIYNSSFYDKLFINRAVYDIETNWSAKADILKYEIIYHEGGIYSDIDAIAIKQYNRLFDKAFVCYTGAPYNDIGTCLFGFAPQSSFLKYVIDCIAEVRGYDFDYSTLETKVRVPLLTGPIIFTQCFQFYNDPGIQMINQDIVVLNKNNPDAFSYHTFDSVLPNGWHNQK
jgi:hypothetical protein